jgi:hypothetical protein
MYVLLINFNVYMCPFIHYLLNMLHLPCMTPNHLTNSDMKANNYEVAEAGETITFRGLVARSTSQAFFLTFCTALGMASLALVLQIQFQDLGKWFACSCYFVHQCFQHNHFFILLLPKSFLALENRTGSSSPSYPHTQEFTTGALETVLTI